MRKFYLFTLLTIMLIGLTRVDNNFNASKASNGFDIEYLANIYEPVEPYSSTDVSGTVHIVNGINHNRLRIKYELYSPIKYSGTRAYASGYASSIFSYPSTSYVNYSFTINDTLLNYARLGITVRLGLYDLDQKNFRDYIESHLYTKEVISIDIDDIDGEYVLDRCLYLAPGDVSERYNFSNYSHIVELESYYRLDISSLSFRYKSYKPFVYKEAYLTFSDTYNLFPYINNDNNEKVIPLKAIDHNGDISFRSNNLFVNKETLEMSSKEKEGFISSNYFYLPKNKISKLQGLSLNITVKEMGVNRLSYMYPFRINIDSLLLGPCNSSLYCVVGGVE